MPAKTSSLSPRARAFGLCALALLVALYVWWPMLEGWTSTQGGDGQYFHKLVEAGRVSVAHFHELPLWDPYECGGRPLWDNPQSLVAAPLIWLNLLVGTSTTMKLWYLLHTAAGFVSMWLFCRRDLGVGRAAAFAASVGWAAGGFHMHHYSGGHAAFVTFELMPLALFFWRRAENDDRYAMGLGLLVALLGLEGAALPLLYFAVLLAAETLTRLWPPRRVVRIARAGAITLAVGIGVGAVRFFPVIDQLRSHKRPIPPDFDHMTATSLRDAFVNGYLPHLHRLPNHVYVWGEYSCYVGWLLLVLAVAGVVLAGRRHLWLGALLALAVALMVGYQGALSPWGILNKYVYPLKEMRVPARFNAQASFVLLAYAALAVDALGARLETLRERFTALRLPNAVIPVAQAIVPMLAILGAGDVLGHGINLAHEYPTGGQAHPATPRSPRLYYGGRDIASFVDQPQQNRGRAACYEPWAPYEGAAIWDGDVPQARAAGEGVVVTDVRRTQNTFDFDVQSEASSKVLVNSSFDLNWRASLGRPFESNRMLAVEVPGGVHHVHLFYRPRSLGLGALVTAAALAATAWGLRRRRAKAKEPSPATAEPGAAS